MAVVFFAPLCFRSRHKRAPLTGIGILEPVGGVFFFYISKGVRPVRNMFLPFPGGAGVYEAQLLQTVLSWGMVIRPDSPFSADGRSTARMRASSSSIAKGFVT